MRDANTFNNEYLYQCWLDEVEAAGKPRKNAVIKDVLFYGMLICLVAFAMFANANDAAGKRFGPMAYHTVLTNSMRDVYPPGTLIVSWALDETEPIAVGLDNGTDIVFIRENGSLVVHRVIEVTENYEESGQRAFRTQGVNNPTPDTWTTYEGNVLGKVVFSVPYIGAVLAFISENILAVGGLIILVTLIIALWKSALKKEPDTEQ